MGIADQVQVKASSYSNLDLLCAKVGREAGEACARKLEKKSIGRLSQLALTLHKSGVYGMFLMLRQEEKLAEVDRILFNFLKARLPERFTGRNGDELDLIHDAFEDRLHELIFAKELLGHCLDYAHAHAKLALKDNPGSSNGVAESSLSSAAAHSPGVNRSLR